MGVLDRFEKGIERAVNGAFAKAFRSEVQPVEIASALRRECDDRASIVGRDRTIAPNTFVVELGPADHDRLGEWEEALGEELGAAVQAHAQQQRYAFVGPVSVSFDLAEDLDTGVFRVRSSTTRAGGGQPGDGMGPSGYDSPPRGYPAPGRGDPYAGAHAAAPDAFDSRDYAPPPPPPVGPPDGYSPAIPGAPARNQIPRVSSNYPGAAAPPSDYPGYQAAEPGGGWASPAPAAAPLSATLDVDGRSYRLSAEVTVIGRSSDADIVLDDPGVSRRHAEVHLMDGRARVIDLGSTNGTFVDGERVHAGNLAEGSTITVGRTRIIFHAGQW